MCDWCKEHGAGKKWYFNIKNYSREVLRDRAAGEAANAYFMGIEPITRKPMGPPPILSVHDDEKFAEYVKLTKEYMKTNAPHRGQVVPLEDVRKIIRLSGPMAKIVYAEERLERVSMKKPAYH